jgi:hypothetical protein
MDPRLTNIPAGTIGNTQDVRVFTNPAIQAAINYALADVPADKRGVVLEVNVPETGGVTGVVAARLDNHWSIGLVGAYSGEHKVSAGARVAFQW